MIKIISEETVRETAAFTEIISAVEKAFGDYESGLISVPDRITLAVRGHENSSIFLVASHEKLPYYALKQASSFPANRLEVCRPY